ncbi:MAG: CbiX/SirB N-terminal domain-containing protein [Candidatus Eisenbacteria bacterium]|nr:CbiX/SirB N-terminal domain-containing protein [Candidatus Eisenbacteria bacterium]
MLAITMLLLILAASAPSTDSAFAASTPGDKKIGVLIVSHGSRSETWRAALQDLGARVRGPIVAGGRVADVRSAFMEYTEPSIATRLKEFDHEGYTDVVVMPVFLTVSPHPFDDIPTIMGQKTDPHSLETLRLEGIERYTPRARTHMTPLMDFTDLIQRNVERRVRELSQKPAEEGLVLVAYGDETYEREWSTLLIRIGEHVRRTTGVSVMSHAWCGHIVRYDPARTTDAIETVLRQRRNAIVIPVLVARDERFQVKLIGDGISRVAGSRERVRYRPDAILPDSGLERWIVDTARQSAKRISSEVAAR